MKRTHLFLFSLFFLCATSFLCLAAPSGLQAKKIDPRVRVLLVTARSMVDLSSNSGIKIRGEQQPYQLPKRIHVKNVGWGKYSLNQGNSRRGSVFLDSSSPIMITLGKRKRSYEGLIEIKPHKKGFYLINHIGVEKYLEGVLNAEISTKWPMEIVKAQTVLARTYALKKRKQRKKKSWDLYADHRDQVYKGSYFSDERGRYAINQTRGVVISYKGRLAETFYHSNCGGWTEDPANVWAYALPYYSVREVPYGMEDPIYYWKLHLSHAQMQKALQKAGVRVGRISDVKIMDRHDSYRVNQILVVGSKEQVVLGKNFRKAAGYTKVKSLLFEIEKSSRGYWIKGRGNGHGVGLCQWAGKEMAERGMGYTEIIDFFYQGVSLQKYKLTR